MSSLSSSHTTSKNTTSKNTTTNKPFCEKHNIKSVGRRFIVNNMITYEKFLSYTSSNILDECNKSNNTSIYKFPLVILNDMKDTVITCEIHFTSGIILIQNKPESYEQQLTYYMDDDSICLWPINMPVADKYENDRNHDIMTPPMTPIIPNMPLMSSNFEEIDIRTNLDQFSKLDELNESPVTMKKELKATLDIFEDSVPKKRKYLEDLDDYYYN